MAKTTEPIRGTRDIIGDNLLVQKFLVEKVMHVAENYCYQEIVTPIFENSSVFFRTLGETSDMVSKETYTFTDRDKTSITLRPEFTAAIVRALLSNSLTQSLPLKLFSYGPLFRHERPQHCRYRQFHQISFEYFGALSHCSDVEVISMADAIIKKLLLSDAIKIEVNTLGNREDRANYREKLINYFSQYKDSLSEESLLRLERNPLRILDSKSEKEKSIVADAPSVLSELSQESKKRFDLVKEKLSSFGINYVLNDKLVRGMDYYTHTVFEFTTKELGSQGTVLAGGRYDNLVELMGGPQIPAVGFALGVERLAELYKKYAELPKHKKFFYLVPIGEKAEKYSMSLSKKLRSEGLSIELEYDKNLKKRMQRADKIGAKGVIIFGENELSYGRCKYKCMKSGKEEEVHLESLANFLFLINKQ